LRMQPRRLFIILAVFLSLFCSVFAKSIPNPVGTLFQTIYLSVVRLNSAIITAAYNIHKDHVATYFKRCTGAAISKANEFNAISESAKKILENIKTDKVSLPVNISDLQAKINSFGSKYRERLQENLDNLGIVALKLQNPDKFLPTNEVEAEKMVNEVREILASMIYSDLVHADDSTSVFEKVKHYCLIVLNHIVYFLEFILAQILKHVDAFTLVSFALCFAAVFLSVMLKLIFLRVLWWLIKLPFRAIYALVRFISKSDAELNFNADTETLVRECSTDKVGQQHQSSLPSVDFPLKSDETYVDDIFSEYDNDPIAKQSVIKSAPSSAALVSSVAAFIAAVAFLI